MKYIIAIFSPVFILFCITLLVVTIEPLGLILGYLFYGTIVLYSLLVIWTIGACFVKDIFLK